VVDAERLNEGDELAPGASEVGRVIPNAPLQLPNRRRLFHTPPPWAKTGDVFFITICCAERRRNQLATDRVFTLLSNALEHYGRAEKLWPHLFLAMPDHFHALLSFPGVERMDKIIRDWKRFLAKNAGIVWQVGFFDHRLRDHESLQEKAHYIRMNPVRAGLVSQPEEWLYTWPVCAAPETAR
jgi:putative transposase